ncbi:vp80 [Cyclophragma undans nucleopolyhedrovirus]|uniref:Vp80 n=1 Tax=Cyclophragma undans nucleopolyhedrovirus TaxID=1906244 RepID=A0A288QYN9_9ABAC|nr:vp80 [Cyclophragma undans nucleopolyhedrovirus]AOT85524.1 vp80 [Cyclophragma undans nucleopolyhedrovirus]
MEDSQSLDVARLTAEILTRNLRAVKAVVDNNNYTNEEKIKTLFEMASKAVGATTSISSTPAATTAATTTTTTTITTTTTTGGDIISAVIPNAIIQNSIIVANNFQMRYNILDMGVNFYEKHKHLIVNKETMDTNIGKVKYYLTRYLEYVSNKKFEGQKGFEEYIIKAEDYFNTIEELFMQKFNAALIYGMKDNSGEETGAAIAALDDVNAQYSDVAGFSGGQTASGYAAIEFSDTYTDDDEQYNAAYQVVVYNDIVKTVLLRMIEKARAFAHTRLHITTLHQMDKLRNHINSNSKQSVTFYFNINDCSNVIPRLVKLCEKFFDLRCVPDTLESVVDVFYSAMPSLTQNEIAEIKVLVNKIVENVRGNPSILPTINIYRQEYESIQNKNVKMLFDLYSNRSAINLIDEQTEMTLVAADTADTNAAAAAAAAAADINAAASADTNAAAAAADAGIAKRKLDIIDLSEDETANVVSSKKNARRTITLDYTSGDDENDDITDYEYDRLKREIEDEAYLSLKSLEFSKEAVNENLQKIINVTNDMKRLYQYCNCKNSLDTTPNAQDYASLLKYLNTYNLNHIQMSVNFYEMLFPLTLYDDNDDTVFYKIVKYIFLASVYFQNCAKNFYHMRQTFNMYGPFNQIDHMVMFVIKFNFLCDLRHFVNEVNELYSNKHPNVKIHSMLVMRDKVVNAYYSKLQYHMPNRLNRRRRNVYLYRLMMLMNGDYNII